MRFLSAALALSVCVCSPSIAAAQEANGSPEQAAAITQSTGRVFTAPNNVFESPKRLNTATGFWAPYAEVPRDFARFFGSDTARIVGVGAAAAFAAHPFDDHRIAQGLPAPALKAGNIGGNFLTQVTLGFGTYALGRATGSSKMAAVGADLTRAQLLSQGIVQAGKMLTTRTRPDGSNQHSLPSGHTASAFATATVLQRHFGWKAGVPAYAFGAYVASTRMGENRHYLSDVLVGAAVGVAAGRSVTMNVGRSKFDLGVRPTQGGAALTFTRR